MTEEYRSCRLCPHRCGADRTASVGRCGVKAECRVAAASLHLWEEPCIAGKKGAGTVFFSGCSLHCVFCQNREISAENKGEPVSVERLAAIFRRLEDAGAATLDLVTPTHYAPTILEALALARPSIPVVWNSGGYELPERIPALCRAIDVYMPDLKYYDPAVAAEMCGAPDYFDCALASVAAAVKELGACRFDAAGVMTRGVLVRHLLLPGHRADSVALLRALADAVDVTAIRLSLMAQYTPFRPETLPPALRRRVTGFEYESVRREAERLGFAGYAQGRDAARESFLPAFDLTVLGEPL